jgi:hypothetical protein
MGTIMTRKEELLASFDDSWRFGWESLDKKLDGVTAEESLYLHPMYADEPLEAEHPPEGTILWHLVHLANVYKWYLGVIEARPQKPEIADLPLARSIAEARENLRICRQKFRDHVAALSEEALDEPHFDGRTPLLITRMMTRHDAWHTAQITVLRRLYRTRTL